MSRMMDERGRWGQQRREGRARGEEAQEEGSRDQEAEATEHNAGARDATETDTEKTGCREGRD
jgi:hypothetical protein